MGILDDLNDADPATPADLRVAVIVPAAGRGQRFAAGPARDVDGFISAPTKIEMLLDSQPVFMHALSAFCGRADVVQVILAVAPDRLEDFNDRYGERLDDLGVTRVAGGTADRWQTVVKALEHVSDQATHIAVHDAARPLVSQGLIDRVFGAAAHFDAVVPGLPVPDTLVHAGDPVALPTVDRADAILGLDVDQGPGQGAQGARPVTGGLDRAGVFAVQTPQVFTAALLRKAYAAAGLPDDPAAAATDDASRVAALGAAVHLVQGDAALLKLTHPGDAEMLAALRQHQRAVAARDTATQTFFDDDDD